MNVTTQLEVMESTHSIGNAIEWGRFKGDVQRIISENEKLKEEKAKLKYKLARIKKRLSVKV